MSGKKLETTHINNLFEDTVSLPKFPVLETSLIEDIYDEIELIGFPVSGTLFDLAKSDYRGSAEAKNLTSFKGETIRIVGNLVTDKTVKTKNGKIMKFGTFLDIDGDFIDTVHFPQSLIKYPLRGSGLYLIEGKVTVEYDCPAIEVQRCGRMPLKPDPRTE